MTIISKAIMPITSHIQSGVAGADGGGGGGGGGGATDGSGITVKVLMAASLGTGSIAFTCQ